MNIPDTAETQEIQNIYGCDSDNTKTNEIKNWIEHEKGWIGEDDRTDEREEWEEYTKKAETEKQREKARAAVERLKMTRTIAMNQMWYIDAERYEKDEITEEEVKEEMDKVLAIINKYFEGISIEHKEEKQPESHKWRAKTIEQYNEQFGAAIPLNAKYDEYFKAAYDKAKEETFNEDLVKILAKYGIVGGASLAAVNEFSAPAQANEYPNYMPPQAPELDANPARLLRGLLPNEA